MENLNSNFIKNIKSYTRNPLGIIALFISLIYGFACLVLSTSLNNLEKECERLPLIWFIILFPILILIAFTFLVVFHHKKLYAPSDYKDEQNFVKTHEKPIPHDYLENVKNQLQTQQTENPSKILNDSISRISNEIEKQKEKFKSIPINNLWNLNHWGSNCASLGDNKMIFSGIAAPKGIDGSHIDLNNILEIGKSYEISCFAKSDSNTGGKFQLWCHDNTGVKPEGSNTSTPLKTPSTSGERISLIFEASFNNNIRIHLQYVPGKGKIEINDLRLKEL